MFVRASLGRDISLAWPAHRCCSAQQYHIDSGQASCAGHGEGELNHLANGGRHKLISWIFQVPRDPFTKKRDFETSLAAFQVSRCRGSLVELDRL